MVDFVGLLKRTIEAQSNATPALRQRIYDRTRDTVERQMAGKNLPPDIIALQRRALEKAVDEVEDFYRDNSFPPTMAEDQSGVFDALQRNAGIRPPPAADYSRGAAMEQPGRRSGILPDISPYGYYPAETPEAAPAYGGLAAESGAPSYPFMAPGADHRDFGQAAPAGFDNSDYQAGPPFGGMAGASPYEPYDRSAAMPAPGEHGDPFPFAAPEGRKSSFSPYGNAEAGGESSAFHHPGGAAMGGFTPGGYGRSAPGGNFARQTPGAPVSSLPDFAAPAAQNTAEKDNFYPRSGGSFQQAGPAFDAGPAYTPYNPAEDAPEQPAQARYAAGAGSFTAYGEPDYPPEAGGGTAAAMPSLYGATAGEEMPEAGSPAGAGAMDFSPLPDFLLNPLEDEETSRISGQASGQNAADNKRAREEADAFNLEQALAMPASGSPAPQPGHDTDIPADLAAGFPDLTADEIHKVDVLLPEMQSSKTAQPAGNEAGALTAGAGSGIAPGIFAQAAIREKRRSGKKRLKITAAVLAAVLAIFGGIFWFLNDFLNDDKHSIAALIDKAPEAASPAEPVEKANQRLMPDGQEEDTQPPPQDNVESAAEKPAPASEETATGEVEFHEAQTALMPATFSKGAVKWSLIREKTPEAAEDTILRGEISVPSKDIFARITFRPNHDAGIPAVYLAEIMFIVPENFEGVAVDKISPLMFKATEESTGQELQDMRVYRINSNFFVVAMNTPEQGRNPKLQRNIALIEQLPWLTMNIAYKNGRIGEFNFAKGDKGNALFKQFFEAQSAAMQGKS